MIKWCLILMLIGLACNDRPGEEVISTKQDSTSKSETPIPVDTTNTATQSPTRDSLVAKTYANQRFRNVTVEKTGDNKYSISGEAQIFEANFGWVVEDGHNELLSGYQMTDAGAPEWGKFSFIVEVKKQRPNSTLMMILFESSAKDGSRQHQLPLPLP